MVENGSTDRHSSPGAELTPKLSPRCKVIHEEQRGKGLAVKRGMLEARGEYRFICDTDLSMPIDEIQKFMPPALPGVEIAIGSREASGAVRYNEPDYRHFIGRAFNLMVRIMALPGLQDSQCGFKMFRGDIAARGFPPADPGGHVLRRGGALHLPPEGIPDRRGAHPLVFQSR